MIEKVILVDEQDRETGTMEKMQAHKEGQLHRAFSIFIFNSRRELLIHQRAEAKYHSGGLWTNTCCSHPRPNESLTDAAARKLDQEMGMKAEVNHEFQFIYRAELDNGMIEHELDHVYFGRSDAQPEPNLNEVKDWKYVEMDELANQIESNPDEFTEWFKIIFDRVKTHLESKEI